MSLFKRKSPKDRVDELDQLGADDTADTADTAGTDSDVEPAATPSRVPGVGPFDVSEVDGRGERLDVGALWLPLRAGVELQLQLEEATGQVTGVFVVMGESAVQLQAFAAPRNEGIWREIAEEIAAGITEQGGTADFGTGPFGDELLARVPGQQPDGRVGFQPLRFAGVDGPRWLLRAVFHGQAAVEPHAAGDLEAFVADVVVVRGGEPMGPRELLPLHLPVEATDADEAALAAAQDEPEESDEHGLDPFERGPEITETR